MACGRFGKDRCRVKPSEITITAERADQPDVVALIKATKLLYFAWVREQVGRGEETVDLPGDVSTVAELMTWLGTRDEGFAAAFAKAPLIRAAVDRNTLVMTPSFLVLARLPSFHP